MTRRVRVPPVPVSRARSQPSGRGRKPQAESLTLQAGRRGPRVPREFFSGPAGGGVGVRVAVAGRGGASRGGRGPETGEAGPKARGVPHWAGGRRGPHDGWCGVGRGREASSGRRREAGPAGVGGSLRRGRRGQAGAGGVAQSAGEKAGPAGVGGVCAAGGGADSVDPRATWVLA